MKEAAKSEQDSESEYEESASEEGDSESGESEEDEEVEDEEFSYDSERVVSWTTFIDYVWSSKRLYRLKVTFIATISRVRRGGRTIR